ncbi:MAG: hypothetical protein RL160_570 [Bacteroidota bacterium]|jgi:uncharacterized paraquat-inducible protein A
MKKYIITLALMCTLAGMAAAQCPMCKTSLESNRKEKGLQKSYGNGINDGILYLLAAPYLIVGTVGFFWWKNQKAKKS